MKLIPPSQADGIMNEIVETQAERSSTTPQPNPDDAVTKDTSASNQIPTGIRIDGDSGGLGYVKTTPSHFDVAMVLPTLRSYFGSSVFVFVVGAEKKIFAAHQDSLTSNVLFRMCTAKAHMNEDYRIELPDVDEEIFAAALYLHVQS